MVGGWGGGEVAYLSLFTLMMTQDPCRRAARKDTSHGIEVLLQDTMHLEVHVPNEEVHAKIRQATGLLRDLLTIVKRHRLQWYGHVPCSSGLAKTICKAQWKGEEEADRRRGGKTASGNGQAWILPSPWGQWRTKKNGGNWFWSYLWCPNDPCC